MRTELLLVVWGVSLGILYYVYHGYAVVLRGMTWATEKARVHPGEKAQVAPPDALSPFVSLVLTVHNEDARVGPCLDNLLALDYDRDALEILIASDGSTDRTNEIVRQYSLRGPVKLFEFERLGKSEAQNRTVAQARGEIVAFTDAECTLERDYLRELVRPFADPLVGCVTGHLRIAGTGGVAREQGYYWDYELKLRALESQLGILAIASGSAMSVRRSAFVQLPPDVGEDCMIPLDVALQGLRVVHAADACATDSMASDSAGEFRARARMTLRNWTGTWRRAALLNPMTHPGYAFALWSHKLLRWLSPFFLLLASGSSFWFIGDPLLWPLPLATFIFFSLAVLGWIDQSTGLGLPLVGTIYAFCLANLGFLVGVLRALGGRSVVAYR